MGSTLAQLRTRSLARASFSSAPDSDQQQYDIELGCSEAKRILAQADPDRWLDTQTITLVAGTETYALDNEVIEVKQCFFTPDSGTHRYSVHPFSLESHDGINSSPLTAGTAYLWYVKEHGTFTGESDTSELPRIGEEYAITWAAMRLRGEEEDDITDLVRHLAWCEKRIFMHGKRDGGAADGIVDVRRWHPAPTRSVEAINDRLLLYRLLGSNIHFIEANYI